MVVKGIISLVVVLTLTLSVAGAFGLLVNNASPAMKRLHIIWSLLFSGVAVLHILMNLKVYSLELVAFHKDGHRKIEELSKKFPVFFKGAKPGVLKFKAVLVVLLLLAFIITFLTGLGLLMAVKHKAMMNAGWSFLGMSRKTLDIQHTIWGFIMFGLAVVHFAANYRVFAKEISIMFSAGSGEGRKPVA